MFISTADRQILKVVDGDEKRASIALYDAATGEYLPSPTKVKSHKLPSPTDPNGTKLAYVLDDETMILWNLQDSYEITRLTQKVGGFDSIEFSPDGNRLATLSSDTANRGGVLRIWDAGEPPVKAYVDWQSNPLFQVGQTTLVFVSLDDGRFGLWNAQTRQIVFEFSDKNLIPIARSDNGQWLATWHCPGPTTCEVGEVRLWRLNDGVWQENNVPLRVESGQCCGGIISPDGHWIARLSDQSLLTLLNTQTGEYLPVPENLDAVAMAFSPTEPVLAIMDGQGRVHLQTLSDASQKLIELPSGGEDTPDLGWRFLAFSPDGSKVAATSGQGKFSVWAVKSRKLLKVHATEEDGGNDQPRINLRSFAFSPDSSTIAVAASFTSTTRIQLLDAATLSVIGTMREGPEVASDTITDFAFADNDGRLLLAAASNKGVVYIWDVSRREPTLKLEVPGASSDNKPVRLVFSEDGGEIAILTGDDTVRMSPVDAKGLIRAACRIVSRSLTPDEQQQYLTSITNRLSCPNNTQP